MNDPRSPDDFPANESPAAQSGGVVRGPAGELDEVDLKTLRAALLSLKKQRSVVAENGKDARSAENRLTVTVSYIVGFLEGKGLSNANVAGPSVLFEKESELSRDELLDELEKGLAEMVGPGTRHPAGDFFIQVGTAGLGAAVGALLIPML